MIFLSNRKLIYTLKITSLNKDKNNEFYYYLIKIRHKQLSDSSNLHLYCIIFQYIVSNHKIASLWLENNVDGRWHQGS